MSFPINNAAVQQFASSKNGEITLSLIREFFSHFNMQYSLAVFDPESCEGISYKSTSKSKLATELGLENVTGEPLLHTLVTNMMKERGVIVDSERKTEQPSSELAEKEKMENPKGIKNFEMCLLDVNFCLPCIHNF